MGSSLPLRPLGSGALYMLLLALSYRTLTLEDVAVIFRDTAVITAQIMLIIGASALLSWILAREQVPQKVAEGLIGLTDNPFVFLLIVNALLLFLGMLLEPTSALIIVTPILLPVAIAFGVEPGATRVDHYLQPDDRAPNASDGRSGLRPELSHRNPARARFQRRGLLPATPGDRSVAHHLRSRDHPLAPRNDRTVGREPLTCPSSRRQASSSTVLARPVNLSRSVTFARALDMPKSSTHRLLNDLAALGIVRRTDDGRYSLGPRLLYWGEAAADTFDLRLVAEQPMRNLRDELGESVHLYIREHDTRICIAAVEGRHVLRPFIQLGRPFLFASARPASCCWLLPIVRSRSWNSSRARAGRFQHAQCPGAKLG